MTTADDQVVICLHCGPRLLSEFRMFREAAPVRFFDFCKDCETRHGFEFLYAEHQGKTTPEIAEFFGKGGAKQLKVNEDRQTASREAAQRDLANRELSRRHLVPFVLRFMPTYKVGWVHHDICRRLERFVEQVERGESPRLILAMPPRAGKSLLASDFFPSWVFGKHPEWEIISTSYAVTLPEGFSRAIRDRIRSPLYSAVFPDTKMRDDSQGIQQWRLTEGGGLRAAGVGGGITGMGAHIAIVDDPFADDEEAQSENNRQKVKDWFTSTLMTRLAPLNGVLIIATRWHDDDLSGHCLTLREELVEQGVPLDEIDDWELISYPALAEGSEYLFPDGSIRTNPVTVVDGARLLRNEGDALHPERYDAKALRRKKNTMPPRQWNAMFQQNPVPDDGEFFVKDDFQFELALEGTRDEYTFVSAWDLAIGEKRRNDWSVGVVVAADRHGRMHVVDMVRGRYGTNELVLQICDMLERWECHSFGMEHGQISMTIWPLVKEEMRRRKITCMIDETLKPILDKEVRASTLRALMQTHRVFFPLPQQNPWVERAMGEMLRFPAGQHDDIVDALAWAAKMFKKAPRPTVYEAEARDKETPFRDRLEEFGISEGYSGSSFMAN